MKQVIGSSEIYKIIYYTGIYLRLSGKDRSENLKFHMNNSSYFKIGTSIFEVPPYNKWSTLKLQN